MLEIIRETADDTCIHLRACNALARATVGMTGGIDCTNCEGFEPDETVIDPEALHGQHS